MILRLREHVGIILGLHRVIFSSWEGTVLTVYSMPLVLLCFARAISPIFFLSLSSSPANGHYFKAHAQAIASSSLSTYLSDRVNMLSSLCIYTTTQTTKFYEAHLQAGEWYLDCSRGFVPGEEKHFFVNLVSSVSEENIDPFE
jgi:hypothetical protein